MTKDFVDLVDFLLQKNFRFLDNIFHKWLENFDITQFHDLLKGGLSPSKKKLYYLLD